MPDAKTFFEQPPHYIIALLGEPGSGKTRQALTFPDCYAICCDPAGLEVLKDPRNAALRKNLVWYEYFAAEAKKEARDLFKPTDDPENRTSIYGMLAHVKAMAREGKIKTLVVDGYSYLSDLAAAKIASDITGTSDGDKWAYYRQLKNDMTWITKNNILSMATRYDLNIILTLHVQREVEEQQKKQANRDVDIAPRLEGSFRSALAGMPRAMIYLDQRATVDPTGKEHRLKYVAYCQRVRISHMGIVPAKNHYGLPAVMDLTDKNLYDEMERLTSGSEAKPASSPAPVSKPVAVK